MGFMFLLALLNLVERHEEHVGVGRAIVVKAYDIVHLLADQVIHLVPEIYVSRSRLSGV